LGKLNFPALPKPERPAFGFGLPPLMLIPTALLPARLLEAALGLPAPLTVLPDPPPVPAPLPSGEIATFAARFPLGTSTTGAGGPGAEDNAMIVSEGPAREPVVPAASSGVGTISPFCVWATIRGADPVLTSNFGRSIAVVIEAILISAGCVSRFGASAVRVFVVSARFTSFGRSFARVSSLISNRGREGAAGAASCTMLGIDGRNFGASMGADGLRSVWRG